MSDAAKGRGRIPRRRRNHELRVSLLDQIVEEGRAGARPRNAESAARTW